MAQANAQQRAFSTHDWNDTGLQGRREAWADVKSPGDGRTYAVGTCEVRDVATVPPFSLFSSAVALPVNGLTTGISVAPSATPPFIQVTILQVSNEDGSIAWQRYFFGESPGVTNDHVATNARGISVCPVFDPASGQLDLAATRIAICGESYDFALPLWQPDRTTVQAAAAFPAGFIAVFDGNGALQWTHSFFDDNPAGPGDAAITDVSVRVLGNGSVRRDVVTYCGISTVGAAGVPPIVSFVPFLPFAAPTNPCPNAAGGATDNGTQQWDGMVGRLSRLQSGGATTVEFHSVVGGSEQDGLFGIAEIDENRFVVVGSSAVAAAPANSFPFTVGTTAQGVCPGTSAPHCVGVVMIFDAKPTVIGGPLLLETSVPLGTAGPGVHTFARDVFAHVDSRPGPAGLVASIYVVGSTDDPALLNNIGTGPVLGVVQTTLLGPTDGFVVRADDFGPASLGLLFVDGTFRGGLGRDGLTGVAGWNEHPDHVSVFGFTEPTPLGVEFDVATLFLDTPGSVFLTLLRQTTIGGDQIEVPNAMGTIQATVLANGFFFDDFQLGPPQGGGISVGPRGRVNVVGATDTTGAVPYPRTANTTPQGRPPFGGGIDAARTVFDMLPVGVGRSDGTGTNASGQPLSGFPTTGASGGTTPACLLAPFGRQVGVGAQPPPLRRMMIDYENPVAPAQGVAAVVLVDRPPPSTTVLGIFVDINFPQGQFDPVPDSGVELWTSTTPATQFLIGPPVAVNSFRFQLPALPAGPLTVAVQTLYLVSPGIPNSAGFTSCGNRNVLDVVASPALFIDY